MHPRAPSSHEQALPAAQGRLAYASPLACRKHNVIADAPPRRWRARVRAHSLAVGAPPPLHTTLLDTLYSTHPFPTLSPPPHPTLLALSGDAYQVLGISGSADASDLKEAYRRLAREHHPDRHQGEGRAAAELRFQEISQAFFSHGPISPLCPTPFPLDITDILYLHQAYQLLSDTEERKRYDRGLDDAKTAAARAAASQKFRAQSWCVELIPIPF